VLGAGGSVGVAYHGAVLAAIQEVTGWDPRRADVIVGTSAGSISAAMLRAGVPAGDLMRISEGLPLSVEGAQLAQVGRPHRPRPKARDVLHIRPMADPLGVVHGVAHWRSHPVGALVAALLPSGGIPTDAISSGIDAAYPDGWPADPLWLCAVGLRDGKRVVFGQPGAPEVPVGQAVAASCAVPGYFKPVAIGGKRYVDGGVCSLTNVDLVAGLGLDLVIVSSPMSQAAAWPAVAADSWVRQPLRAQLHGEVGALRRAGVPVVAIEPSRQMAQAMGLNPMDARPRGTVSRVTYAGVARWLAEQIDGRWLVAMLAVAAASAAGSGSAGRASRPETLTAAEAVVDAVAEAEAAQTVGGTLLPSA
jgi:NTE family protein